MMDSAERIEKGLGRMAGASNVVATAKLRLCRTQEKAGFAGLCGPTVIAFYN